MTVRIRERLQKLCNALQLFGLPAIPMLRRRYSVSAKRCALADEIDASLIVLGTRGRSAVQELLAGSTFENVVRLSRQAVLVVCPQEK